MAEKKDNIVISAKQYQREQKRFHVLLAIIGIFCGMEILKRED